MLAALREMQRKNCLALLSKLSELRRKIAEPCELRRRLEELHTAFLRTKASFAPRHQLAGEEHPSPAVSRLPETAGRCVAGGITFVTDGSLIVGVDGPFPELEPVFVNKPASAIGRLARLYSDYESRACDLCGRYLLVPTYETPVGRAEDGGTVLCYHLFCKERQDTRNGC